MAKKEKEITPQRKLFCDCWLLCMNATEAAIQAGYSPKTAGSQGHDLLKIPEIREYIEERRKQREELVGISQEKILRGLVTAFERSLSPVIVRDPWGNPVIKEVEMPDGTKQMSVLVRDNPKATVACADQIAKYQGWHAPAKIQEVGKESPMSELWRQLFGTKSDE